MSTHLNLMGVSVISCVLRDTGAGPVTDLRITGTSLTMTAGAEAGDSAGAVYRADVALPAMAMFDDLIGGLVAAKAEHGERMARYQASRPEPLPQREPLPGDDIYCRHCDVFTGYGALGVAVAPAQHAGDEEWLRSHCWVCGRSAADISAGAPVREPRFVPRGDALPVRDPVALREAARLAAYVASPEYQAALREAEAESWDQPGVDVEDMIRAANERRAAAKAGDVATDVAARLNADPGYEAAWKAGAHPYPSADDAQHDATELMQRWGAAPDAVAELAGDDQPEALARFEAAHDELAAEERQRTAVLPPVTEGDVQ